MEKPKDAELIKQMARSVASIVITSPNGDFSDQVQQALGVTNGTELTTRLEELFGKFFISAPAANQNGLNGNGTVLPFPHLHSYSSQQQLPNSASSSLPGTQQTGRGVLAGGGGVWSDDEMMGSIDSPDALGGNGECSVDSFTDILMSQEASRGRVLGIAGCTNSGKTTIAKKLLQMFTREGGTVKLVCQDDFYLPKEKVNKVFYKKLIGGIGLKREKEKERRGSQGSSNGLMSGGGEGDGDFYYNYDCTTALDKTSMVNAIKEAALQFDYVIVDGNMLTEIQEVMDLCDRIIFLIINQKTCRRRREQRTYDPPDVGSYFDDIVWPAYQRHLAHALAMGREDKRFAFVDASSDWDDPHDDSALLSLIHSFTDDIIRLTFHPINVEELVGLIVSPSCGAISAFVGTTRDTFNGRRVTRLDYESYDEMAYKELRKICSLVRQHYPTVERCVIVHRLGEVPIGETCVLVACASPHRKDAIHATEMAIDALKSTVPIFKKELYEDGGCAWKENGEFSPSNVEDVGVALDPRHPSPPPNTEEKSFAEATRNRDSNRKMFWLKQMLRQMRQ